MSERETPTQKPGSAAIRVFDAFTRAITLIDSVRAPASASQGWAVALDLGPVSSTLLGQPAATLTETTVVLLALATQINEMRSVATRRELSPSLWEATLNRAQRGLSLENLSGPFTAALNDIRPDMKVLEWCAHTFPSTENEIPAEEIDALLAELRQVENIVIKSRLPNELKLLLLEQLDIIRRSLREYRVTGAVAIRRALYLSTAALQDFEAVVAPAED
ncbi:MAG TPA: hypothetical protein VGJ18_00105 [Gemmatimonadaceae bacterium]